MEHLMNKSKKVEEEVVLPPLQDQINLLRQEFSEALARINGTLSVGKKRLDRFATQVRAYDPTNMLEMEKRHSELSSRFQLLIEKITVVTEVGYFARHTPALSDTQRATILAAAICAMDEPDAWWKEGADLNIKSWARRVMKAYHEKKLLQVTQDRVGVGS